MTLGTPQRRPARRRHRGRLLRPALLAVGIVVIFAIGVALGEALHDQPKKGGTQTLIRQLRPLPLAPLAATTVTVTTTTG